MYFIKFFRYWEERAFASENNPNDNSGMDSLLGGLNNDDAVSRPGGKANYASSARSEPGGLSPGPEATENLSSKEYYFHVLDYVYKAHFEMCLQLQLWRGALDILCDKLVKWQEVVQELGDGQTQTVTVISETSEHVARFSLKRLAEELEKHNVLAFLARKSSNLHTDLLGFLIDELKARKKQQTLYAVYFAHGFAHEAAYMAWGDFEDLAMEELKSWNNNGSSNNTQNYYLLPPFASASSSRNISYAGDFCGTKNSKQFVNTADDILADDIVSRINADRNENFHNHLAENHPRKLPKNPVEDVTLLEKQRACLQRVHAALMVLILEREDQATEENVSEPRLIVKELKIIPSKNSKKNRNSGNNAFDSDNIFSHQRTFAEQLANMDGNKNIENNTNDDIFDDEALLRAKYAKCVKKTANCIISKEDLEDMILLLEARIILNSRLSTVRSPANIAKIAAASGLGLLAQQICLRFGISNLFEYCLKPSVHLLLRAERAELLGDECVNELKFLCDSHRGERLGYMFLKHDGCEPLGVSSGNKRAGSSAGLVMAFRQTVERLMMTSPAVVLGQVANLMLEEEPQKALPAFVTRLYFEANRNSDNSNLATALGGGGFGGISANQGAVKRSSLASLASIDSCATMLGPDNVVKSGNQYRWPELCRIYLKHNKIAEAMGLLHVKVERRPIIPKPTDEPIPTNLLFDLRQQLFDQVAGIQDSFDKAGSFSNNEERKDMAKLQRTLADYVNELDGMLHSLDISKGPQRTF